MAFLHGISPQRLVAAAAWIEQSDGRILCPSCGGRCGEFSSDLRVFVRVKPSHIHEGPSAGCTTSRHHSCQRMIEKRIEPKRAA